MWDARLSRKGNRLFDREGRKVDVILGTVLNVSTEMTFDVQMGNGVVVDRARDRNILVTEVCESLEESSTTGTRFAKDDYDSC